MTNPPQKTEWMLLIVNISFVLTGLVLLPSSPDAGIVTIAFFGTCLVTTLAFQWRRHLDLIFRAQSIEVAGGVKIKPQRRIIFLMGGWLAVLGPLMYVYSGTYPPIFQWLCLLIGAIGIGLVIAAALGLLPRGFLQFDPEGLTIGTGGWTVQLPWDSISNVGQGEYHMNPVVYLDTEDSETLVIVPDTKRGKALKRMEFNRSMLGAPFMLMPIHYGIPSPVLAGAIWHYCENEDARAGLERLVAL
jgi:hypothetical protein